MVKRLLIFILIFSFISLEIPGDQTIYFDGSDDIITILDHAALDTQWMTATFWMWWDDDCEDNTAVITRDDGGSNRAFEILRGIENSGTWGNWLFAWDSVGLRNSGSATTYYEKRWYHVAVIWDGNAKLFVDGVWKITKTFNGGALLNVTRQLDVGAMGGANFKGYLDDIRFYDTPLSTAQIRGVMSEAYSTRQKNLIFAFDGEGKYGAINRAKNYSLNIRNTGIVLTTERRVNKARRFVLGD